MVFAKLTPALAGLAAGLLISVAGCGVGHYSPAIGQRPSPASPAPSRSTPSVTLAGTPQAQPAGGPVPSGFAATSVTFVSASEAFVLGTAPCAAPPCTSIVRTLDRGATWRGVPAPREPVGRPALGAAPVLWGIRFAAPAHGFVFGDGLWETWDGGAHWGRDAQPGGSILALATLDGQLLALAARCSPAASCAQPATLLRRPLGGGAWRKVASVRTRSIFDTTDLIATQADVAAMLDGTRVLVTSDGGLSVTSHPTPCTRAGYAYASSVAVTSPSGLALLCTGQGFASHTFKRVYLSGDGGARWTAAGPPDTAGDGGTIAAATSSDLVIATASAASWLYHSGNAAAAWQTVRTEDDGGIGWADIGFTTTADGVVVHGPADSDGNRYQRPGQLLLTSDGGGAWQLVGF